jgi:hypothetical protein
VLGCYGGLDATRMEVSISVANWQGRRLRLGPADARAVNARWVAAQRGKAGMYLRIKALDCEGHITHPNSPELAGDRLGGFGFQSKVTGRSTRRAYFKPGMLNGMSQMRRYMSPRRRGRTGAAARKRKGAAPRTRETRGQEGISPVSLAKRSRSN